MRAAGSLLREKQEEQQLGMFGEARQQKGLGVDGGGGRQDYEIQDLFEMHLAIEKGAYFVTLCVCTYAYFIIYIICTIVLGVNKIVQWECKGVQKSFSSYKEIKRKVILNFLLH